jgi:hypothetical protein
MNAIRNHLIKNLKAFKDSGAISEYVSLVNEKDFAKIVDDTSFRAVMFDMRPSRFTTNRKEGTVGFVIMDISSDDAEIMYSTIDDCTHLAYELYRTLDYWNIDDGIDIDVQYERYNGSDNYIIYLSFAVNVAMQ